MHRNARVWMSMTIVALALIVCSGCAIWNHINQPIVNVQVAGNELLHVAVIPRLLPDGSPATAQKDALLKDVAKMAGGYTFLEHVESGWVEPPSEDVKVEADDLLLVRGTAELAPFLVQRLRDDFMQKQPFVMSLPVQPMMFVQVRAPQAEELPAQEPPKTE